MSRSGEANKIKKRKILWQRKKRKNKYDQTYGITVNHSRIERTRGEKKNVKMLG